MCKAFYKAIVLSLATVSIMAFSAKNISAAEETEVQSEAVMEEQPTEDETIAGPGGITIHTVISDENVPKLFHKTTTTYQGTQVESAQFDNGYLQVLLITDSNGAADFMCYDESTGELTPFRPIYSADDRFIIVLPISEAVVIPEGFSEVELDWKGQSLPAYIDAESEAAPGSAMPSDFILVYAINSQGAEGLYTYDQNEGTYQRYVTFGNSSEETDKLIDFAAVKDGDKQAIIKLAIVGTMALLILILLILVIVLSVRLRDYSGYEYIDEDDYRANMGPDIQERNNYGRSGYSHPEVRMPEPDDEDEEEDEDETQADRGRTAYQQPVNTARENYENAPRESRVEENHEPRRTERPSRQQPSDASRRRALLETTDIADLDDILNDPNLTSNLPLPSQIEKAARQMAINEQKKSEAEKASYENMQVTVDNYDAGMPAMVDTEMIKRNTGSIPAEEIAEEESYNRSRGGYSRDEEYHEDRYSRSRYQDPYGDEDDEDDDDDYYLTRAERKERKQLEKQRRREEKEAEKDAKFYERERKRAEKRRKRGYDDPEAMDWTQLQDDMRGSDRDDRRPTGYNRDELPAYVRKDIGAGETVASGRPESDERPEYRDDSYNNAPKVQSAPRREPTEKERADAAADAVIAAARGTTSADTDASLKRTAMERSEAVRQPVMAEAQNSQRAPYTAAPNGQPAPSQAAAPQFSQDIDDDFEFEFLNIKRP